MLSHLLPVKILPQQNETYRTPFSFENNNIFTREGETSSYYLNVNGVETPNNDYCISDYIEVEPLKRYVITLRPVLTAARYHCWYDSSKTFIESDNWAQESFISPQNAKYVRLSYRTTFPATDMHIEVGTITTGVLDLKTGVLTTEYGYISDLSKYTTSLYQAAYANLYRTIMISGAYNPATTERNQFIRCSHYQPSTGTAINNSMPNGCFLMVGGSTTTSRGYFTFRNNNYDNDLAGWKTTLPGIQVWYRLRNTLTYQLTPADIKLLQGYNKITSNATKLQFTYLNDNNETIALTGDNEYIIDDGVFNRSPSTVNQIFEPKQDLHGYDYPWPPGGGGNLMNIGDIELLKDPDLVHINSTRTGFYGTDEDLVEMFNGGEWGYIPILGQGTLNPVGIEYDTPYTLYFRAYTDAEESTSGTGLEVTFYDESGTKLSSISLRNRYTSEREFSYTTFDPDRGEPEYTLGGITIEGSSGLCGNTWHFEFMTLVEGTSYLPYSNICPIEGHTESNLTVEGTPIPDSESERRLKAITRPVFQWDVGLKLKFEGYTFADGTLCQFDNKLTTFSQNEYIVNNECTIPASLLDENCQGDIIAYINVSGNDYDAVVYEVYIPVIKRQKPENFLRPAIELPQAIVASFEDGADGVPLEKLNLPLLPKQDLNGYDYPWVAGGGKNKLNYDAWKTNPIIRGSAVWENNGVTLTATGNDCYTNFNPSGSAWNDARVPVQEGDVVTLSWEESTNKSGGCYIFGDGQTVNYHGENNSSKKECKLTIASGITFVTFRMGVATSGDTISYKNIMVQVNTADTVYTYAPYENICPITGYTEANVTRTGKNLFDLNYLSASHTTVENGVAFGTAYTFKVDFGNGIPIPKLPQGRLTISADIRTDGESQTSDTGLTFRFRYTDGSQSGITVTNNVTTYTHYTATSSATKEIAYIYISYNSKGSNTWYLKNIQLQSEAQTDPEDRYEPYEGEIYTIPFSFEGPNVFTRVGETENSYINSSGNISTSQAYCLSDYIEVEECKRYVFDASTANVTSGVYHAFYNAEKTRITFTSCSQEFFIPPTGAKYIRLSYRKDSGASDFHISIGTVPHGTLDVKSGILTVDYAYINDLSNYHFARSSASLTYIFNTLQLTNMKAPPTSVGRLEGCASSGYKMSLTTGVNANMTPYSMLRNNARLYFRNDDYNDNSTGFRASLSGHQAIYELTSPCTYQLTPTEVKTLLGYNNIWADTGEVEVSYYPDPYLHFET